MARVIGTTVHSEPVKDGRRRVRLVKAIVVNGAVCGKGDVVDVAEHEARVLLAVGDAIDFVDEPEPIRHADPIVSKRR